MPETVDDHLRRQGRACRELGSPLYGDLLERAADDTGVVADVLTSADPEIRARPGRAALGLRLLGAVHRRVLDGREPELAAHYPSTGGTPGDADAVWEAFRSAVAGAPEDVCAGLIRPPQTNEIGRSAPLLGALACLTDRHGLPIRLVEIGASAGLNLRPDLVRCAEHGPPDSPVQLGDDAWTGALPPAALPRIVERRGVDPDPLDPLDRADALTLRAYVWPDQHARRARLDAALALAATHPLGVERRGGADAVAGLAPVTGTVTVVWHSIVLQYLDGAERGALEAGVDALASAATRASPVARVALEPRRVQGVLRFLVTLTTWPTPGEEQVLGAAHAHGLPVTWGPVVRG